MGIILQFAGATDIGKRRRENQDRWRVLEQAGIAAVADGMGGLPHGAEAAEKAIAGLTRLMAISPPTDRAGWHALLDRLNQEVFTLGLELSPDLGIGTTLTVAHFQNQQLTLAHVGDSAAFRLRAGQLTRLTEEHTVAAEFAAQRASNPLARAPLAAEHMLTSCLGLPFLPRKDVRTTEVQAGDRFLLCSDGLTKPVETTDIASALGQAVSPEAAAAAHIGRANAVGGPDNITVIVVFAAERADSL